jgi:aminoglycoside phosphotransferase (APT) family kinase protein
MPAAVPASSDALVPVTAPERAMLSRLGTYLSGVLGLAADASIRRFAGGRANLTYEVRSRDEALVVRRRPLGELPPTAHDMAREHTVMSALAPSLPFVPRIRHLCEDSSVIGAPFLVMERRYGEVLRQTWPVQLPDDPALRGQIADSLLQVIIELHAVDPARVGLTALGRPNGYMQRQVAGWQRRWRHAALRDVPAAAQVFDWLADRLATLPPQSPAIVHNDLKLENVMLDPVDPSRVGTLLDWDMCTRGDPLADIGLLLAYWGQSGEDPAVYGASPPLTAMAGFPSRDWLVTEYARRTGRDLAQITFYRIYGLAKWAVLGEQLLNLSLVDDDPDPRVPEYEQQVPALFLEARRLYQQSS